MALADPDHEKQCHGKKPFDCRMAAESALAMVRFRSKFVTKVDLYANGHVYICGRCSFWHLTKKAVWVAK